MFAITVPFHQRNCNIIHTHAHEILEWSLLKSDIRADEMSIDRIQFAVDLPTGTQLVFPRTRIHPSIHPSIHSFRSINERPFKSFQHQQTPHPKPPSLAPKRIYQATQFAARPWCNRQTDGADPRFSPSSHDSIWSLENRRIRDSL